MERIDLHTHSTFSDGTLTPTELIHYAKEKGLQAIALTDHDTINGLEEAKTIADQISIEFIPGVEVATTYHGIEIHILGLFIDTQSTSLHCALQTMAEKRNLRNMTMLKRLNEQGIAISEDDLMNETKQNIATRAHFAKAIISKGFAKNFQDAFTKYLSPGCPTYLERETFSIPQTIDMIHKANGLSILAHPLLYKLTLQDVEKMIQSLQQQGLDGIESIYSMNSMSDDIFLGKMAKKYRLKVSGGSDFHGKNKEHIDLGYGRGHLFIPYDILTKLKQA